MSGSVRGARGLLLCLGLTAAATTLLAAAPPGPRPTAPPAVQLPSIAAWEVEQGKVSQGMWVLHDIGDVLGPDAAGKSLSQYADEYLMTPAVVSRLDALKAQAQKQQAAGDTAGLQQTLGQASAIFNRQELYGVVIGGYGALAELVASHRRLIDELVPRLPPAEREAANAAVQDALAPARATMLGALRSDDDGVLREAAQQLFDSWGSVTDSMNRQRDRLAKRVSAVEQANGVPPPGHDRQSPCPPPAARTSGQAVPATVHASIRQPEYPPQSRRMNVEGTAVLRFHVSPTGCSLRTEIAGSTGVDALDSAALAIGDDVQFLPAERDGKPVESTYAFAITFKLTD